MSPHAAPAVQSGFEWFEMIISYLKVKSMAVWFHSHPECNYECFEEAWPFMLDEMMFRATRAAVEQLKTTVTTTANVFVFVFASSALVGG